MAQGWSRPQAPCYYAATGTSTSGRTATFGVNVTAGSLIYVWVSLLATAGTTVTVSGSVNGSYTQAGSYKTVSGTILSLWYFANSGAGAETVTVTPSATAWTSLVAIEVAGINTSSPLDSTQNNTATSATPNTGTVTVSQADEMVIGGFSIVYGSGYLREDILPTGSESLLFVNTNDGSILIIAVEQNASSNVSIGFTASSRQWLGIGASFKAPSGGGGGGGSSGMPPSDWNGGFNG